MNHKKKAVWAGAIIMFCLIFAPWITFGGNRNAPPSKGVSYETVADYVHSVIEADRTIYTTHVVNRMQDNGIVSATEHWKQENGLPLPAQFLNYAGRMVAKNSHGVHYRLISLWPIYRRNGPATDFERRGLETVLKHPDRPFAGQVSTGKRTYFQAIYADKAVAKACVTCHNKHPLSPKRDFKLLDVMGGIVITIPLEK